MAIFASGTGTNAQRIMEHFSGHPGVEVALVLSNDPKAQVLKRAEAFGVETMVFGRDDLYGTDHVLEALQKRKIDLVVLAGFLWLIPPKLIKAFPDRIINVHPALLPRFGGKGMYGYRVHEAVKAAGEKETGMTVHLVNEEYDRGRILFQASCPLSDNDTVQTITEKVHALEHAHFPEQIERYLRQISENMRGKRPDGKG